MLARDISRRRWRIAAFDCARKLLIAAEVEDAPDVCSLVRFGEFKKKKEGWEVSSCLNLTVRLENWWFERVYRMLASVDAVEIRIQRVILGEYELA